MRQLSNVERAYIAGIIDGEGSLYCRKVKSPANKIRPFFYRTELLVGNTNLALLEKIKEVVGDGRIYKINRTHEKPTWSPIWHYKLHTQKLSQFLLQIKDFLIAKRTQAEILVRVSEINEEHRSGRRKFITSASEAELEELYDKLRMLNKRGPKSFTNG